MCSDIQNAIPGPAKPIFFFPPVVKQFLACVRAEIIQGMFRGKSYSQARSLSDRFDTSGKLSFQNLLELAQQRRFDLKETLDETFDLLSGQRS